MISRIRTTAPLQLETQPLDDMNAPDALEPAPTDALEPAPTDALEPAPTEVTPSPLEREILDETPDKARFWFICSHRQIYP